MKKILLILCILAFGQIAIAGTYVRGYYRKDGTYVSPHYRRNPSQSLLKSILTPQQEQERAVKVKIKSGNKVKIMNSNETF